MSRINEKKVNQMPLGVYGVTGLKILVCVFHLPEVNPHNVSLSVQTLLTL